MAANTISSLDIDMEFIAKKGKTTDNVKEAALLVREALCGYLSDEEFESEVIRCHTDTITDELFYDLKERNQWPEDWIPEETEWQARMVLPDHIKVPMDHKSYIPPNIKYDIFIYFGKQVHEFLSQKKGIGVPKEEK